MYLGNDFRRIGRNIIVAAFIGPVGNHIRRVLRRFELMQRGRQLYSGVVDHSHDSHAYVHLETVDNGEANRAHNRHQVSYRKRDMPCLYKYIVYLK